MKHLIVGVLLGLTAGYLSPYLNTFNFPIGFMFIGLGLGITFCKYLQKNDTLFEKFFWIYIFIVSGLAYSGSLNLRYETSMGMSNVPLFYLFFPLAVSVFIFIFCIAILSLKDIFRRLLNILAVLTAISGITVAFVNYLWLPSFLASFLVWVALFVITVSHFFKEKIGNLGLNLFVLFVIYIIGVSSIPLSHYLNSLFVLAAMVITIGVTALIISLLGNILYLINIGNSRIHGKISFSWVTSFSAIICNYTIFLSIFCILIYRKTADFLVRQGQLTKMDVRIAFRLSVTTLAINLIYMICYETCLKPIWTGFVTDKTQIINSLVWGLCSGLASYSLGKGIINYRSSE
ncbi:MAG: hypothetical protein V4592_19040 [Bacteroidota bacterium]